MPVTIIAVVHPTIEPARRRVRRSTPALLFALVAVLAGSSVGASRASEPATVRVIVQAGSVRAAAAAVRAVGGAIERPLPIVDGVAARVGPGATAALSAQPGVVAVTPNAAVRLHGAASPPNATTVNHVFPREVNADRLWREGVTGTGVRVALIDTGISDVPDLANKVVPVPDPTVPPPGDGSPHPTVACVDLSGEGTCEDGYGHGTFMAGLIAGSGAMSGGRLTGVAPGAELVSVKIAGRNGSADVSKVLAAIQWVVSFSDDLGIRVLNLSLGTDSTRSYKDDPLNFAVERAWQKGIVVVVAASNRGPAAKTISKPGDDPFVITVGAVDDRETPAVDDDRLPRFSGRGPTATDGIAKPDVVAPGGRVVSLRVKNRDSLIDERVPQGGLDDWYRRGSGTSMATAITSGVAALVLDANDDWHPSVEGHEGDWVPNRVKYALTRTARKVAVPDPLGVGFGLVDAYRAAYQAPAGLANQGIEYGDAKKPDGTYTPLDEAGRNPEETIARAKSSRGTVLVTSDCDDLEKRLDLLLEQGPCDVHIHGETTANGGTFNAQVYATSEWSGSSWYGSSWYGSSWYGSSWYGSSWYGSSWYGSSWYGSEDETDYGTEFEGSSWYGAWE